MNINKVLNIIKDSSNKNFDIYERRPGKYQVILPILHEDGDMVDIYLQDSPKGESLVRICDFGMTLMRLSNTFEINTDSRQKIFKSIIINNDIKINDGNLYLDTNLELLYECILQFSGCIQKVCNMRYWVRETTRSTFYDDMKSYITTELSRFEPKPKVSPLPNYDLISVDWVLSHKNRNLYLFGVLGNDKAKNVAISLLEFQKETLPFISFIVHENMEELGQKERLYLTRNADTQYPTLNDFQEQGTSDILRLAA